MLRSVYQVRPSFSTRTRPFLRVSSPATNTRRPKASPLEPLSPWIASGGRCLGSGPRAPFPSSEKYPSFSVPSSLRPSPVGRGERVGTSEAGPTHRSSGKTRPVLDKHAAIFVDRVPLVLHNRRKGVQPCHTSPNPSRATQSVASNGTSIRKTPLVLSLTTFPSPANRRHNPPNHRPNVPARKSVDYHPQCGTVASPLSVVEPVSGRSRSMPCMRARRTWRGSCARLFPSAPD